MKEAYKLHAEKIIYKIFVVFSMCTFIKMSFVLIDSKNLNLPKDSKVKQNVLYSNIIGDIRFFSQGMYTPVDISP